MTGWSDDDGRRLAVILVTASTGHVNAARGLIGRAIRKALGVERWGDAPHFVRYYGASADPQGGGRRYVLDVTDEEFEAVTTAIWEMANEEGWNRPPIDAYHD